MTKPRLSLLCLLLLLSVVTGFVVPKQTRQHDRSSALDMMDRRQALLFVQVMAGGLSLLSISKSPANAVMAGESAGVFQPGEKLSVQDAKKRFDLARKDVQYLLDHYTEISRKGGDEVRRYLGTVGVTSGMYGITKVLKQLQEEADDLVEYTETMDEFNAYLYQAEGAAYQSLFVEHSSAKGTPESFLATAKQDVIQMNKYMNQLASQLSL